MQQFDEVRVAYGSTNKGSGVVPKSDCPAVIIMIYGWMDFGKIKD